MENLSPLKARLTQYDSDSCLSEDYDRCDEFGGSSKYTLRSRVNELSLKSPMKRTKNAEEESENVTKSGANLVEESPKKRARMPPPLMTALSNNNGKTHVENPLIRTPKYTNKGSVSLCIQAERTHSSTPKSDRKLNLTSRLNNSEAMEKNMSNNWGDILEELEVQSKELNEYVEKVCAKYKIDKEKLLKCTESDAECLRKRQKRINFGKVTPEYERYVLAVDKRKREPYHPRTPNKFRQCSRRKFDGLIKKWRKQLHVWDENPEALKDFKFSIADSDEKDLTDEFGCTSKIEGSVSYNIDDYDILDVEIEENDLEAEKN